MAWHYEHMLGAWVEGRCVIRDALGKPMPKEVKDWLNSMGPGDDVDPHKPAPTKVREWLFETIEDPDWG